MAFSRGFPFLASVPISDHVTGNSDDPITELAQVLIIHIADNKNYKKKRLSRLTPWQKLVT